MKFSTRADIEAPIEAVFDQVTDFAALEQIAAQRGAVVQRVDGMDQPGAGMRWTAEFPLRGKTRKLAIELEDYDVPSQLGVAAKGTGLTAFNDVELVALSPTKTRMFISVDVKPQTLSARLLVQSMKLAKGRIEKEFSKRVAGFAKDIEAKHSRTA